MADDLIGIDIENLEQVMKALEKVPREVKLAAIDDVADYLQKVLQAYPTPKSVSRKQAYGGTGWFGAVDPVLHTTKQQRFFFAALKDGRITVPYKRSQNLARSWQIVGKGEGAILVNDTSYAKYVYGSEIDKQANMMAIIGWKTLPQTIRERMGRIGKILQSAVNKGIKKAGL